MSWWPGEQKLKSRTLSAAYAFGIVGVLLVYGLWQERIMSRAYGEDYFSISVFLVLLNRFFGAAFALVMVPIMKEAHRPTASFWKYGITSLSTVGASFCQYESLKYLSFTVSLLGKTFKMMPVMLWGMLLFKRRYRLIDWFTAAGVTIGVIWFMLSGPVAPDHSSGTCWYGILLMFAFIALDAFTATFQEKLFAQRETTKYNQMLYINVASAVFCLIILFATGRFGRAFAFCAEHPGAWGDICIMSAAAVLAQWLIYSQVQDFGALAFATTMNFRQVASVVASYVAYKHEITTMQIVGLVIFFAALGTQCLLDAVFAGAGKPLLDSAKEPANQPHHVPKKGMKAGCCLPIVPSAPFW